jgi:hypothetical protein
MDIEITSSVAAFASNMPMRSFRHLVTQGYSAPYREARQWGRYTAASVVVLAVAGRLSRYLTFRDALAVALATIEPIVQPVPEYCLTPPFILRATDGMTLAVVQTADGPAATLNPVTPPAEGVLIDVAEIATSVIERLAMIDRISTPLSVSGATRAGGQLSPARERSGAQHQASRTARALSNKAKESNS